MDRTFEPERGILWRKNWTDSKNPGRLPFDMMHKKKDCIKINNIPNLWDKEKYILPQP